ncbi:Pyridoxine/pyridoxamine 5'-phosphate oxidase [Acromyrmex echinatior]|uniref:pyridoxal 5'-phosphate synthase n=1 Tax=Acromyrmex echinatior TaxID=103372 RepID=F4X7C7_ACREC|nr:Pyridoxine/pyridoxamine 5'-phosphate oxidase [Acromyrmex echinatior]
MTDDVVGFARIDPVDNPVDLFRIWYDKAIKFQFGLVNTCCLATVSSLNLKVSSRNLILREFDDNGFVIMTDTRSQKVKDMVRIEGLMKKLDRPACQLIYEREPLHCKIRTHLCHQDQPADWDNLNRRYNEILVQKDIVHTMPDHVVAYKLAPEMMEFYYARDTLIADRIHYNKINENWEYQRIAA